jgi:8-oxo-dGTP diphosphatase
VLPVKKPILAVDLAIICGYESLILIKRKNRPYKDSWALPGGFVEYGETVESAAIREAKEETGLKIILNGITGVYSDPKRDPRGHVISICFIAEKIDGKLKAASDASDAKCFSKGEISDLDLAFDHKNIIKDVFELKSI